MLYLLWFINALIHLIYIKEKNTVEFNIKMRQNAPQLKNIYLWRKLLICGKTSLLKHHFVLLVYFHSLNTLMLLLLLKSLQLCPTLCDPIDGSPPGSAVPGILQARTLEWVAMSFSNAWKWKVKVKSLSCVRPSVTPWTAAYQAPLFMGFARQEYWSGVPLPSLEHSNTWYIMRY